MVRLEAWAKHEQARLALAHTRADVARLANHVAILHEQRELVREQRSQLLRELWLLDA
jgi:hypothetical protein